MNMHKRIRLTPLDRREIWRLYQTRQWKVTVLAQHYRVSRPSIYNVLKKARLQQFTPSNSTNNRYKTIQFGLKRLAKVEARLTTFIRTMAKNIRAMLLMHLFKHVIKTILDKSLLEFPGHKPTVKHSGLFAP